ncbi:uncharacterized protein LOC114070173 [Empidonax traillii]|uniref:uncharacterized protein LOC114070173 n=1 Tax=Empidonax traillii TaxID=164674 RepID=UPI000FFD4603|nr:uncharacterized protein LOC114070173 [Empidonax traillii]
MGWVWSCEQGGKHQEGTEGTESHFQRCQSVVCWLFPVGKKKNKNQPCGGSVSTWSPIKMFRCKSLAWCLILCFRRWLWIWESLDPAGCGGCGCLLSVFCSHWRGPENRECSSASSCLATPGDPDFFFPPVFQESLKTFHLLPPNRPLVPAPASLGALEMQLLRVSWHENTWDSSKCLDFYNLAFIFAAFSLENSLQASAAGVPAGCSVLPKGQQVDLVPVSAFSPGHSPFFSGLLLFPFGKCLSALVPVFPLKAKPEFLPSWKKKNPSNGFGIPVVTNKTKRALILNFPNSSLEIPLPRSRTLLALWASPPRAPEMWYLLVHLWRFLLSWESSVCLSCQSQHKQHGIVERNRR